MVHILSLVLIIVLLYFVSIIKYYVKTVMLQSQYSELATITVHRKNFLLSLANILCPSQIFTVSRKIISVTSVYKVAMWKYCDKEWCPWHMKRPHSLNKEGGRCIYYLESKQVFCRYNTMHIFI